MWDRIKAHLEALLGKFKSEIVSEIKSSLSTAPTKSESPQAPAAAATTAAAPAKSEAAPSKEEKKDDKKDDKSADAKAEGEDVEEEDDEDEEEKEAEGKSKTDAPAGQSSAAAAAPQASAKAPTMDDLQNEIKSLKEQNATLTAEIAELKKKDETVESLAAKKTSQALMKQGISGGLKTTLDAGDKNAKAQNGDADLLAQYESMVEKGDKGANAFGQKHQAAILRASLARDRAPKAK